MRIKNHQIGLVIALAAAVLLAGCDQATSDKQTGPAAKDKQYDEGIIKLAVTELVDDGGFPKSCTAKLRVSNESPFGIHSLLFQYLPQMANGKKVLGGLEISSYTKRVQTGTEVKNKSKIRGVACDELKTFAVTLVNCTTDERKPCHQLVNIVSEVNGLDIIAPNTSE